MQAISPEPTAAQFHQRDASPLLLEFYEQLLSRFGKQYWWPGDTPWEVAVGAILTQNTNWRNVEKAIDKLKNAGALPVGRILEVTDSELANLIRSSGYFNIKAKRLQNLAVWWDRTSSLGFNPSANFCELRSSLLSVKGIGEETADSILLYAFNRQTFVVDAYTKRFLLRHKLVMPTATYQDTKSFFERNLPASTEIYKEYHALIVVLGKHHCKPTPQCEQCPLRWHLPD